MRRSTGGIRVLMMATDAHGGFGGISRYNCDVLDAMSGFDRIREVVVVPRIVNERGFSAPRKISYDLAGTAGLGSFLWRNLAQGFAGGSYDVVYCAHINLLPIATAIARARRVPLVLAIYGIDVWERPPGGMHARLAARADLVISISEFTLDRFRSWSAVNGLATAVLPNTIRAETYGLGERDRDLAHQLGLQNRKVVMTLGRMSTGDQYKGFDEMIALMPRLRELEPDIVYLAAGDGDDRPRLQAKARALGVGDRVVFSGHVPESRKSDYYRLADAYVMPSSGEGLGFVVLEALACGIPVVASTADGTREAVRHGALGAVVDPKDTVALLTAIVDAVRRPKQVPEGLGYFSFECFAARLHQALARVVDI